MNKSHHERKFLYFLFFFALTLRIGYLVFLKNVYFFFGHPSDDVTYYKAWAQAIVFAETPTTAFAGMPLFPYYLAVLFRIFGGNWFMVNIFNLMLGSLNCILVYLFAKKLFSARGAVLTSLLAATNFILIYYDWLMMPVTLLITLSLTILLSLSNKEPSSFKEWILLGIFIGLAALGDGKFLIFAALLIGYLCWSKRKETLKKILQSIFPLTLGLILILGGITIRNKIVSGDWIFITSQSGLSLFVGNNLQANGAFENPEFIRPSHTGQDEDQRIYVEKLLGKKVSPSEVSDFYHNQAINFMTQHPIAYLHLLWKKFILFISDAELSHDIDLILQRNIKLRLDLNPYILIFPLAVFGIFITWKKNQGGHFATLLIVAHLIYCLIYFVTTRQRAPILPLLLIFETASFLWIAQKLQLRQPKALVPPAILLIIFAVLFPPQFLQSEAFAFLYHSKAGSVYDQQKNYQKAERSYLAALALSPTDSNTLFNLGTAYLNQNEFKKAEKYFLNAIKFGGFNVDATFDLGYIYEKTEEIPKALNAYHDVLTNTPESLDAAFRIANIYQNQGNCPQAKIYFEKIIRAKPALRPEIYKILNNCQNKK